MVTKETYDKLLSFPNYSIEDIDTIDDRLYLYLKKQSEVVCCPLCNTIHNMNELKIYHKTRTVQDETLRGNKTYLVFDQYSFNCPICEQEVTEKLDFVEPYERRTVRLNNLIMTYGKNLPIKTVCELFDLTWNTAKRVDKKAILQILDDIDFSKVKRIAIDEISFQRKHRYLTIITDRDTGLPIEIVEGKKMESIAPFLK